MGPRLAIEINLWVRDSSNEPLTPNLDDTSSRTLGSSCSSNAWNCSSVLAKANVSLPVVRLIFIGGVTPTALSNSANWGLLINSFLVTPEDVIKSSFSCLVSLRCCFSRGKSNSSTGSTNMRRVQSIKRSSCLGKSLPMMLNSL